MPPINPAQTSQTQPQPDGSHLSKFVVLQPGEQVVCEVKRHPIGLLGIYFSSAIVVMVILAAVVAAPHYVPSMTQQIKMGMFVGALIVLLLTALYMYIARSIYTANRWIVTTDSITQINQIGLFNTQTSQLSMANLEDVTVEQDGILQQMFRFGTLRVESAGARGKFLFPFCPNPTDTARKVIAAHEAYIAEKPSEMVTTNRPLATTNAFNQPPSIPNQDWPGRQQPPAAS